MSRAGAIRKSRIADPSDGGMRDRVNDFDWSATPLGPRANWPFELEIVVQQILDSSFPKAVVWGKDLTTIYNDAFLPILGAKPEALGRSFADVWAEAWDTVGPICERAREGVPTYIENLPLVINRSGREEKAWFTFCYSPLRLRDGSVAGMLDTVIETTDTVRAQAELDLVNGELGHRLKNTLALVQAIASQTLRKTADPAAMQSFTSRIAALAQAHDILMRQNWSAASLSDVIAASLEPHSGGQFHADGPDVQIGSHTAVALSLMLHELATNAAKYGALASPEGQVSLSWAIEDEFFHLHWREHGGPIPTAPVQAGFGSRLIDMGVGRSSTVERRFEKDGLTVSVRTPVSELKV